MSGVRVNNGVVNYGGTPSIGANTAVNRPAAGVVGRLFIDTTNSLLQYDTGAGWVTIGSGGGGITGTGIAGQAAFWTGATSVSGDNAFFWDNTNKRLGINTATPGVRLDIHGAGVITQFNGTGTNNSYLDYQNAGSTQWRIGNQYVGALNRFSIYNAAGASEVFTILQNGNIGVNVTNPLDKVQIGGSITINDRISAGGTNPSLLTGDPGSYPRWQFIVAAKTWEHGYRAGTLNYEIREDGTTRMVIANGGNIGLGSYTAPNLNLAVSGSIYQGSNTANSNFQLLCNQNFYTVGFSPNFSTYTAATVNISVSSNLGTGYVFKTTAAITVNLPAASGLNNQLYFVVLTGTTVTVNRSGSDVFINNVGTSVTSLTLVGHTKTLLYSDGGTTWYQLF